MSTPEIFRLRRRIEALTEGLDEQAEQVAPNVWVVPSRSRPDDFHIVTHTPEGTTVCDCEGAKAGQPCRHAEAVACLLERAQWERKREAQNRPLPSSKRQLRKEVQLI